MKIGCVFWPVCAAGIIRGYREKLNRAPHQDSDYSDYVQMFCFSGNNFLVCEHYKIRTRPANLMSKTALDAKNARRARAKEKAI